MNRRWIIIVAMLAAAVLTTVLTRGPADVPVPPELVTIESPAGSLQPGPRAVADTDTAGAVETSAPLPPDLDADTGSAFDGATLTPAREYIVAFETAADLQAFTDRVGGTRARLIGTLDIWHMARVRSDADTLDRLLDGLPVSSRQRNHVVRAPAPQADVPAGSRSAFGRGALRWLGADGDISMWGNGITVAVLDTATMAPQPSSAGTTVTRFDLVDEAEPDTSSALAGHGTAVASLLVGHGEWLQGISPAVNLLAVGVMDSAGVGDVFTVAEGIVLAVDQGADLINVSLGTDFDADVLRRAVAYAAEHDVLIIASTGNAAAGVVTYPARYETVLAVSAIGADGEHAGFANTGDAVDVAAPGLGVYAAWTDDAMVSFSGTSTAAPFVTGTLAAMISMDGRMSADAARSILLAYADDNGFPGEDEVFGAGVLNVRRIMSREEPGIHDMGIASHYLATSHDDPETVTIVVSAQNRGTEPVATATLVVRVGESERSYSFQDVAVGESVSRTLNVDATAANAAGDVEIWTKVIEHGSADSRPLDNERTSILRVTVPAPAVP
ncbi:MAG: S8 family serine peptidase [Lentisphaeria bacterium]|jgi:thermitase|nr:S8 family serine peptidase [Lentisphaeria bacterium]MDP7743074.1 S8 family serine peptidase [Lentisphaeria bacterium]